MSMEFAELAIPDDFDPFEAPEVNRALAVYAQLYPEIDVRDPDFGGELLLTCFPIRNASISVVRGRQDRIQAAGYLNFQPHLDADYLEGIAVDEPVRGQGFGRFLMERLIEKSRVQGRSAIELRPAPGTVEFYEKLGFTCNELRPNVMRLDIPRSQAAAVSESSQNPRP